MWEWNADMLQVALRTAVVYFVVLAGLRLTGKREVGQMTPFDLVLLLLIANAVQNAMTGPDVSLTGGIIAAAVLLLLNKIVSVVVHRFGAARRLVEGVPTILVFNGKTIQKNLDAERISQEELEQALREHGVDGMSDVRSVVLEVDGAISVLKFDDVTPVAAPHRRIRFVKKP